MQHDRSAHPRIYRWTIDLALIDCTGYGENAPPKWLSESDALGLDYYYDRKCKARMAGSTLQPRNLALSFKYINQLLFPTEMPHTSTIFTSA
jgi:hypothetical protein